MGQKHELRGIRDRDLTKTGKIIWMEKISNEKVWRIEEKKSLMNTIRMLDEKELDMSCCKRRNLSTKRKHLEGKKAGKTRRESPRIIILEGCSTKQIV